MAKQISIAVSPQADRVMTALRIGAGLTIRQVVELALNGLADLDPAEARQRFNNLRAERGSVPTKIRAPGELEENPFADE